MDLKSDIEVNGMKKVVIAFIAGALLMISGQALAEQVSRIGLKVGGEAAVYLNGKQLSDAIIVDNKSYAPVRDIAEAFNSDVEFVPATKDQKAVISLEMKSDAETIADLAKQEKVNSLNHQKNNLLKEKEGLLQSIEKMKISVEEEEITKASVKQEWAKELSQSTIDNYKKIIAQNETRLAEIATLLAEVDEELSELEAQ